MAKKSANSGNFRQTKHLIWEDASPFWQFFKCSEWLYDYFQRAHSIALEDLVEAILKYLTLGQNVIPLHVGQTILRDYTRIGRKPLQCLKPFTGTAKEEKSLSTWRHTMPRQHRHLVS